MFAMIVTGLVTAIVVALIFAALLQFASRVIFGESIEFGDAFKVALPAIAAMGILNRFLLGDLERLPLPGRSVDGVVANMVLHHLGDPREALRETARVLRPGGKLIVVDFLRHEVEALREQHAHRWLGFAEAEIGRWAEAEGLEAEAPILLRGEPLTVGIWTAAKRAQAA